MIDVHHHFLPERVMERLRWLAGGAPRLVDHRLSMTLSPLLSDAAAHLHAMDVAGVDTAVLTYSGVSVLGGDWCRDLNDGLAEIVASHPGRLEPTAHVNLDDPNAAEELHRCVADLRFSAAAIPCSTPATAIDSPSLDRLWSAVAELDVPVILHPALLPSGASTDYGLERSCARPFDTTVAAVRLLCGVLPRFPTLRFVLPHCGGTAAFLRGRLSMFFNRSSGPASTLPRTQAEQRREGLDVVFSELWSRFWFDTAGTGGWKPAVEFTASVVGANRLMFGSDFPLESHSPETLSELVQMIDTLDLTAQERNAIAGETARLLLRGER